MATEKSSSNDNDARIRRPGEDAAASAARAPRSAADAERTQLNGTTLSAQDRLKMIRDEFRQEALPAPPEIPGWHLCWLSSTSTYDPINKRMRLGYEPVRAEELPGYNADRMNSGMFEGAVTCNEMVLFKIPQDTYEMIMKEFHHDQPMREEENLKANLRQGQVDSSGKELDVVEGFEDLAVKRGVPNFA